MSGPFNGYVVAPEALVTDAAQSFEPWAERIDGLAKQMPKVADYDFSIAPGAQECYKKFVKASEELERYMGEGSTVLMGFADALRKTVTLYATAEEESLAQISRLSSELGPS